MCLGEVVLTNLDTNTTMAKMDSELTVDGDVIFFTTALMLNSRYDIVTVASNNVGKVLK